MMTKTVKDENGIRRNIPLTPEEEARHREWLARKHPNGLYPGGKCGEADCPCAATAAARPPGTQSPGS